MNTPLFRGCAPALVTPFQNGEIDEQALLSLVDFQLQNGAAAIIACGTTGEPSTMSDDEWARVLSLVVRRVDGRVPVWAGTGGNDTKRVIAQGRRAKALGADAQLCVTPYYNKTTQAGLIAHYTAIADDGALPVVMYNVPARTGLNMLPETVQALCAHENIIALKDACGSMIQSMQTMALCGNAIAFYCGEDAVNAPMLLMGAQGLVSVASNIAPAYFADMAQAALAGETRKAADMHLAMMRLYQLLFCETSPIPVKYAMRMMGLCSDEVRLPLVPMGEHNARLLCDELRKLGLCK